MPQSKTGAPALAEMESRIDSLHQQSEAAAAEDDYDQACAQLLALESTLADYQAAAAKLEEQRQAYEKGLAELPKHLPTSGEPGEGRLAELLTKIETLRASADAAAKTLDFVAALKAKAGWPRGFWSARMNVFRYAATKWTECEFPSYETLR